MVVAFIPTFILQKLFKNYSMHYQYNVLLSNFFLIVILFVCNPSIIQTLNSLPHFCLLDKLLVHPCPFCGVTRSVCALANLQLAEAYHFNAIGIFVVLFIVLQIPLRLFVIFNVLTANTVSAFSKWASVALLTAFVIHWLFTY
jgi:Protein of unknown function (DUF2752)